MLQDLSFGKLNNAFRDIPPAEHDIVICLRQGDILLKRNADDTLELPRVSAVKVWAEEQNWQAWDDKPFRYIFCLQDVNFFLWMGEAGECDDPDFCYESTRQLRQLTSKDVCSG